MFIEFLLLALLGWLIAFFGGIAIFQRGIKEIGFFEGISKYWKINQFYLITGLLFLLGMTILLTTEGSEWLIVKFTSGQLDGSTDFSYYLFCMLVGMFWFVILSGLRKVLNPLPINTQQIR